MVFIKHLKRRNINLDVVDVEQKIIVKQSKNDDNIHKILYT